MRKLIITEKNNTAARIATILSNGSMKRTYPHKVPVFTFAKDGDEYTVVGLRGHILNLDYPEALNAWEKVNLKQLIWAEPIKVVTAPNVEGALRDVAGGQDEIVVATDFDREGELIGVEALEIVQRENPTARVRRARYSSLTKWEIEEAFRNLAEVDHALALAAESRQLVDLAWGAVLTRFISMAANQVGRDFLSVGRVQTPSLALIVDREREIEEFVPKPYWTVLATFDKGGATFTANHEKGQFWAKRDAEAVLKKAKGAKGGVVSEFLKNEKTERGPPPFNTTMFVAEANRNGLGAAYAMRIAEDLYTSGYISYPRTDNTVYPPTLSLRGVLEKLRESEFKGEAEEILKQETIRGTRGRSEATDHPPIYPTQAAPKNKLRADHWKVYELVVRRFFATVAPPAVGLASEAKIDANGETFLASGFVLTDPGWRKYYPYWDARESTLPDLVTGETLPLLAVEMREDRTKPPLRYTQGALIQEMEKLNLGTKSTRHEIIQKLYDRKYVEGRQLKPTLPGRALVAALEDHAKQITEPEMTAHLEQDMDEIARGVRTKEEVVHESQSLLEASLDVLLENEEGISAEITSALQVQSFAGVCKACGGNLFLRQTKRGARFVGCSNFPTCKVYHPLPPGLIEPTQEKCPECGSPMVKRIGGGRPELFCVDAECPSLRTKNIVGRCVKCEQGEMIIRHSGRGKRFLGCTRYPECDNTQPLPQRGLILTTEDKCDACGNPIIKVITRGRPPWVLCVNMLCPKKLERAKAKEEKARAAKKKARAKAAKKAKAAKTPRTPKAPKVPKGPPAIAEPAAPPNPGP
jgi:DNA topoisomerase-1